MPRPLTLVGALARGVVAGALGTLAMDLVQYRRYRGDGGAQPFGDWELSAGVDDWEGAPAPAQVGRRLVERLFQVELAPRWARLTNNVVHWGYGLVWGAHYGVVAGSARRQRPGLGLVLGPMVFASGYVVLPLARLYKPIWEYDASTLAGDLAGHLAYGVVTAEAFRLLAGRRLSRG